MIQVTMREWQVLTFIRSYEKQRGKPPTINKIRDGVSPGSDYHTMFEWLVRMQSRKLVKIEQPTFGWRVVHICASSGQIGVAP